MADGEQGMISRDHFVQLYPVSILTKRRDTFSQLLCQAAANKTPISLQQLGSSCVIF